MTCILKRQGITLVPYKCKKCGKEIFHIGYCDDCKHMTCKDCIHHHDYSIGNKNICDRYDGYCFVKDSENPVEVCKDFINNDGTYHNDIEHCPKLADQLIRSGYITKVQGFKAL